MKRINSFITVPTKAIENRDFKQYPWMHSITFIGCYRPFSTYLPKTSIEEVSVRVGGLSARYESAVNVGKYFW